MGKLVLRTSGRLGTPRPPPPTKSDGVLSPPRRFRTSPRFTKRSGKNGDDEGGVSVTPGRSGSWSRITEPRERMVVKPLVRSLVMEEVTILKRGEELRRPRRRLPAEDPQPSGDPRPSQDHRPCEDSRPSEDRRPVEAVAEDGGGDDVHPCSTERLGPEPEILPKQLRIVDQKESSFYSGSGFFTSPSPSSLPFPTSLFRKKEVVQRTDFATKGLRYFLRLDLP